MSSPHFHVEEEGHVLAVPHGRRPNPDQIDWARQAHWFEAEGQTPRTAFRAFDKTYEVAQPFVTVSQALKRREIVDTLCEELRRAGFTTRQRFYPRERPNTTVCEIWRAKDQQIFLENVYPHLISQHRKRKVERYLRFLARPRPPRRRRRVGIRRVAP